MTKKPVPIHVRHIPKPLTILACVITILLVGCWDVARGGYLSTLFGQSSDINYVGSKKSCKEGCFNGRYYSWNKKTNTCTSEINTKKCKPEKNLLPSPSDKEKVQRPNGCYGKEYRDVGECGEHGCKSNQRDVVLSYSDCDSIKRFCQDSPSCATNKPTVNRPNGCNGTEYREARACGDENSLCKAGQLEVVVSYSDCDSLKRYCEPSEACK